MSDPFQHPLARTAKVWRSGGGTGILVIVTTLALDEKSSRFKPDKVDQLSKAARDWLSTRQGEGTDFLLVNRARDWGPHHRD